LARLRHSSGCKSRPAHSVVPPVSYRGGAGGDEAIGTLETLALLGGAASRQAVTCSVNTEQAPIGIAAFRFFLALYRVVELFHIPVLINCRIQIAANQCARGFRAEIIEAFKNEGCQADATRYDSAFYRHSSNLSDRLSCPDAF
jgi:hypothetical protein